MTSVKNTQLCQDILATRVAQMIAKRDSIPPSDAIRKFMNTETYGLLMDIESFLYMESAEYILYLYDAEQREDWDSWLIV